MLYLVIAKDGTDPKAPARRQAVRAEHLGKVQSVIDSGFLLLGGALLNKESGMMGSMLLLEAISEEEVWEFLKKIFIVQAMSGRLLRSIRSKRLCNRLPCK
jgi:uncharacterized protein